MSLFHRHKHVWEVKACQVYKNMEKMIWDADMCEIGRETRIYYVCNICQNDKTRTVNGSFTLDQVLELFPKP